MMTCNQCGHHRRQGATTGNDSGQQQHHEIHLSTSIDAGVEVQQMPNNFDWQAIAFGQYSTHR